MAISTKTLKMLWGRAACLCAYPNCPREELIEAATSDDEASIVGDNAHIRSSKTDGPRHDPDYPVDLLDSYENLILLCKVHHKIVDDQVNTYPVEALQKMKADHVARVRDVLRLTSAEKTRDEELYAEYLQKVSELADFENWNRWTAGFFANDIPRIAFSVDQDMEKLRYYLFNRVWPGRYKRLEEAFENFRRVLADLQEVFREHAVKSGDIITTERFYKIREWDEKRYYDLLNQYRYHVFLVEDLALELTRAANFLAKCVRNDLIPRYRLHQGAFVVTAGPFMDLSLRTYKPQYNADEEAKTFPYPGLSKFRTERQNRDHSYDFRESYRDSEIPPA